MASSSSWFVLCRCVFLALSSIQSFAWGDTASDLGSTSLLQCSAADGEQAQRSDGSSDPTRGQSLLQHTARSTAGAASLREDAPAALLATVGVNDSEAATVTPRSTKSSPQRQLSGRAAALSSMANARARSSSPPHRSGRAAATSLLETGAQKELRAKTRRMAAAINGEVDGRATLEATKKAAAAVHGHLLSAASSVWRSSPHLSGRAAAISLMESSAQIELRAKTRRMAAHLNGEKDGQALLEATKKAAMEVHGQLLKAAGKVALGMDMDLDSILSLILFVVLLVGGIFLLWGGSFSQFRKDPYDSMEGVAHQVTSHNTPWGVAQQMVRGDATATKTDAEGTRIYNQGTGQSVPSGQNRNFGCC